MKRENRYEVLKVKDIEASLTLEETKILAILCRKVAEYRAIKGKNPLDCVVVESDWPEYEKTWEMIEKRVKQDELKSFMHEKFEGNQAVYRNLPYFYVVGRKLVCSDAPSVRRLITYTGYLYAIIARDDEIKNDLDLNQYNSNTVLYQPCVWVEPEEIIKYKDNFAELINLKLSSLV